MTPLLSRAETEALLEETGGVPVVFEEESTVGHFEIAGEVVLEGSIGMSGVIGSALTLVVATGTISASEGDVLTADGTDYEVRERLPVEDGELTRFALSEVD